MAQPAFATSGGSGIKPSINGVPPLYVLPQGETLAHSLIASLVTPAHRPVAADGDCDEPWWRHAPTIGFKDERERVGYLHSLTFPARRVRLHPTAAAGSCARCGRQDAWSVQTMVFQMGESRPGDAPFWLDPFAAYRLREDKDPVPVRPLEGRVLWREFAALFLPSGDQEHQTIPPTVVYQLANEPVRSTVVATNVPSASSLSSMAPPGLARKRSRSAAVTTRALGAWWVRPSTSITTIPRVSSLSVSTWRYRSRTSVAIDASRA